MGNCLGSTSQEENPPSSSQNPPRAGQNGRPSDPPQDKQNRQTQSKPKPKQTEILDSKSGRPFMEIYKVGDKLGEGAFSVVKKGTHVQTRDTFAIKVVHRAKLTREDEIALMDEISVLNNLKHNHIIRLYDVFEEPKHYFLVTEMLEGGELFDRIVAKSYYNEKEARDTCKILFEAMHYCHQRKIAHRDLKPENLLLMSSEDDSQIKIADFGFAKIAVTPCSLTTQCGTPGYVAPEILEGVPYDTKADMWSLGVIMYILLGGYPPFIESNQKELFRKIRKGQYEFHEEYWSPVSNEAKDLISKLLTVDPSQRLSSEGALNNSWICGDDKALAGKDLGKNLDAMRRFNAKRKFRSTVQTVMAINKLERLRNSLGTDFRTNL